MAFGCPRPHHKKHKQTNAHLTSKHRQPRDESEFGDCFFKPDIWSRKSQLVFSLFTKKSQIAYKRIFL